MRKLLFAAFAVAACNGAGPTSITAHLSLHDTGTPSLSVLSYWDGANDIDGKDNAGTITLRTSTGGPTLVGAQARIIFAAPYDEPPIVMLTPVGSASVFVVSVATVDESSFRVAFSGPVNLAGNTAVSVNYQVLPR